MQNKKVLFGSVAVLVALFAVINISGCSNNSNSNSHDTAANPGKSVQIVGQFDLPADANLNEINDIIEYSAIPVLRNRLESLGASNISIKPNPDIPGQFVLNFNSDEDLSRISHLIQPQGKLEFYETYRDEFDKARESIIAYDSAQSPDDCFSSYTYDISFDGMGTSIKDAFKAPYHLAYYQLLGYFADSDTIHVNRAIEKALASKQLPGDLRIIPSHKGYEHNDTTFYTYYIVRTDSLGQPALDGSFVTTVQHKTDGRIGNYIELTLNNEGAEQFSQLTGRNIGQPVVITIDNEVYMTPRVQTQVTGGKIQITGDFTPEECEDLAILLRSGALPIPFHILSLDPK